MSNLLRKKLYDSQVISLLLLVLVLIAIPNIIFAENQFSNSIKKNINNSIQQLKVLITLTSEQERSIERYLMESAVNHPCTDESIVNRQKCFNKKKEFEKSQLKNIFTSDQLEVLKKERLAREKQRAERSLMSLNKRLNLSEKQLLNLRKLYVSLLHELQCFEQIGKLYTFCKLEREKRVFEATESTLSSEQFDKLYGKRFSKNLKHLTSRFNLNESQRKKVLILLKQYYPTYSCFFYEGLNKRNCLKDEKNNFLRQVELITKEQKTDSPQS